MYKAKQILFLMLIAFFIVSCNKESVIEGIKKDPVNVNRDNPTNPNGGKPVNTAPIIGNWKIKTATLSAADDINWDKVPTKNFLIESNCNAINIIFYADYSVKLISGLGVNTSGTNHDRFGIGGCGITTTGIWNLTGNNYTCRINANIADYSNFYSLSYNANTNEITAMIKVIYTNSWNYVLDNYITCVFVKQ